MERIGIARAHAEQLLAERERMTAAIEASEKHAREANREKDVLKARIKELEQENEALRKAAASKVETTGREGTKEKIDELVNEIDQCLALLNN